MVKRFLYRLPLLMAILLISGCAYVISREVRREVTKDLELREVIKAPDAYRGKIVLWGGAIIESQNAKEGTRIIVLQKDLSTWGRPKETDKSQGRFIVLYPGYLDTAIYRKDREITVAGEIIGQRIMPIDQIEYSYPILSPREIHLWKELSRAEYHYYPYPWWWDYPYWPYPWYPYRHRPWYWYY